MPLSVSAIIPAYNAAKFIIRTLESIEQQRRLPDETVVVDDGSLDETASLVERFARSSKLNISLVRQTNQGSSAARNSGIRAARGDLLAFLDADDVIYPEFLCKTVSALEAHPHWLACFSDRDIVDANGIFISRDLHHPGFMSLQKRRVTGDLVELLREGLFETTLDGSLIPMTIVCRRRDVEAIDGFDETLPYNEDRLFMLRLIKRGTLGFVDAPLGTWQRHNENKSGGANVLKQHASSEAILNKILSDAAALDLSIWELAATRRSQIRLARSWVYAASSRGATGTLDLIRSMVHQRRITRLYAMKAVGRYLFRRWRGHTSERLAERNG